MTDLESRWIIRSNEKNLNFYLILFGLLGTILILLVKNQKVESINVLSAYLLGAFLLSLSIGIFIFTEKISIQIDKKLRVLKFHKKSLFEVRNYTLKFEEIDSVQVVTIGRAHRGIISYHILILLKNGKREFPGRFSLVHSEIDLEAQKLADFIGCKFVSDGKNNEIRGTQYFYAAIGSVLIYSIWYKSTVGPFCIAMWFGTAPVFIIGLSFLALVKVLRRY